MSSVQHPDHYSGKIECIDMIDSATEDLNGLEAFCVGNAIKYLCRYRKKGKPKEDLQKACEYINMVIERMDGNE